MICKQNIEEKPLEFPNLPGLQNTGYVITKDLKDGNFWEQANSISSLPPRIESLNGESALRMSLEFERLEDFFRQPFYVRFWAQDFARSSFQTPALENQFRSEVPFLNNCRVINSECEIGPATLNQIYRFPSPQFHPSSPSFLEDIVLADDKKQNNVKKNVGDLKFNRQVNDNNYSQQSMGLNQAKTKMQVPMSDPSFPGLKKSKSSEEFMFGKNELSYLQKILDAKPSTPYALLGVFSHSSSNTFDNLPSQSISEKGNPCLPENAIDRPVTIAENPSSIIESKVLKIEPPMSYKALLMREEEESSRAPNPSGISYSKKNRPAFVKTPLWPRLDNSDSLNDSFDQLNKPTHKKIEKLVPAQASIQKRPRGRPRKYRPTLLLESNASLEAPGKTTNKVKVG